MNRIISEIHRVYNNITSNNLFVIITLFLVFLSTLVLNHFYPLFSDDWTHTYIHGSDYVRVNSFADIITSQYNMYHSWGGRVVVHSITQWLLMLDPIYHDILNSLAYTMVVLVAYYIATQGRNNWFALLCMAALIWLCTVNYGGVVLWLSGCTNYVWGTLICLSFCSFYASLLWRKGLKNKIIYAIAFFFAGIVAGWTNENSSLAIIFFAAASLVILYFQKIKIPYWSFSGIAGTIIGACFMFLAPGNYVRMEASRYSTGSMNPFMNLFNNLDTLWYYTIQSSHFYILVLLTLIMVTFYFFTQKENSNFKKILILSSLFFSSGIVSILAILCSPEFSEKTLFFATAYIVTAFGIVYANTDFTKQNIMIFSGNLGFVLLITLFSLWDYSNRKAAIEEISQFCAQRGVKIIEERARGNIDVILDEVYNQRKFPEIKYGMYDVVLQEKWFAKQYAKVNGVNSVKISKEAKDKLDW